MMHRLLSSISLAFLLALASTSTYTAAAPTTPDWSSSSSSENTARSPPPPAGHLPLSRRTPGFKNLYGDDLIAWTEQNTARLRTKYASKLKSSSHKRDTAGVASLVNFENDSTFYSTVSIGTPGQAITLILDTGSSDIWAIQGRNSWNAAASSTFTNSTTPFAISYGSGNVGGTLARDTITLAGHTSSRQTFAIANAVSSGLLDAHVDGIMGLGFERLSTSGTTPFWQASGANEFSFYLKAQNSATSMSQPTTSGYTTGYAAATSQTSDGGYFTLGGRNTSLYQGDINWSTVIDESYWLITLGGISVNGQNISLSGTSKTAVDTGTTLIGAPSSVVQAIYAQVPNARVLASGSGYYQFPCSTNVTASMHFGNQQYTLSREQFIAGTVDSAGTNCMGAFFSIGSDSTDQLQYILGDAFLTQVYTVFNATGSTARVGFASLADGLGTSTTSTTASQVIAASGATSLLSINSWTLSLLLLAVTLAMMT